MHDVFVAGLGVMGSALARELARRGLSVTGCDAHRPPHNLGSSHGESRIIRSAYFESPVYAPLARRALTLWRELEQETGQSLLLMTGGLNIGPHAGALVTGALASAREHRVAHELLDAHQLMERFPALRVAATDVAVFEPDAGVLRAEPCVAAQLATAQAAGAELHMDTTLIGWTHAAGQLQIETTAGSFAARSLLLAPGAWLTALQPELPLRVTRQPVFWFEPRERGQHGPDRLPNYLIEFEPGRVFYGFPDLGNGVKCAIHHEGEATAPEAVKRWVDVAELAPVHELLGRYLPDAAGRLRATSVCLYTNAPDGHFLIDRLPAQPDVWLVSACSGHGFKFAPALAELVADAIVNGTTVPLKPFALSRF